MYVCIECGGGEERKSGGGRERILVACHVMS